MDDERRVGILFFVSSFSLIVFVLNLDFWVLILNFRISFKSYLVLTYFWNFDDCFALSWNTKKHWMSRLYLVCDCIVRKSKNWIIRLSTLLPNRSRIFYSFQIVSSVIASERTDKLLAFQLLLMKIALHRGNYQLSSKRLIHFMRFGNV